MIWLWRDYDPSKTEQQFMPDPAEKSRPYFRVTITSRDAD
jgi:enterochelin esterase family protein